MRETNFRWLSNQDLHLGEKLDFVREVADLAQKEHLTNLQIESRRI